MKTYRVVIIGFAHMHINDVARHFYDCPRTELVACADTPVMPDEPAQSPYTRGWNQAFCVNNFHIPRVYSDYLTMLAEEKPDIAIITSENDLHLPIVEACARHGVGVCIEKPMAVSLSAAMAMARASQHAGTPLLINWPFVWSPAYHKTKQLVDDGAIGRIMEFKIRTSHTGPLGDGAKHKGVTDAAKPLSGAEKSRTWWHQSRRGGGAMLDFCCYGSIMSRWFTGEDAQAVFGMRANFNSQYGDADDNAALLVRFPQAMASIETSWTTPQELIPSNMPMLYGTKGAITVEAAENGEHTKILLPDGEVRFVEPDAPCAALTDIAYAWASYLDTGAVPHETLGLPLNLAAMRILDAGVRSAASGRLEAVNGDAWQIG